MNNKFLIGLVLVISLGFGIYFVTTPKTAEQLGPVFGLSLIHISEPTRPY